MHSSKTPKPLAGVVAQQDEHVVCMIPVLEATPLAGLDWDGLLARGQPPCLPLGAERRTEPRKD